MRRSRLEKGIIRSAQFTLVVQPNSILKIHGGGTTPIISPIILLACLPKGQLPALLRNVLQFFKTVNVLFYRSGMCISNKICRMVKTVGEKTVKSVN